MIHLKRLQKCVLTKGRSISAQVAAAVGAGTLNLASGVYSGTSVGGTPVTDYTAIDNGTALVTTGNPVMVSYNFGKTITLPTSTVTADGKALSGYYFAGFKALDNLSNTSAEQKIGYYYDNTKPAFVGAGLVATNMDGTTGYLDAANGIYYVKESATPGLVLRAYATDRPASDPDGSGIVTAAVKLFDGSGTYIETRTTTAGNTFLGGGSVVYENGDAGASSFIVPNNDGNYNKTWNEGGYCYSVVLTDASGNYIESTHTGGQNYSIKVMIDNTPPTMGYSFLMGGNNILIGSTRYGNAPAITVSSLPSDGTGSGAKAWLLDDSATATTGSSWITIGTSTASDLQTAMQTKINGLIKDNTFAPKALYIHLLDNAGNIGDYGLDGTAGHLFKYDSVAPVYDTSNNQYIRLGTSPGSITDSNAYMMRNGAFFKTAAQTASTVYEWAYVSDRQSATGTYESGISSIKNAHEWVDTVEVGTSAAEGSRDNTYSPANCPSQWTPVYDNQSVSSPILVGCMVSSSYIQNSVGACEYIQYTNKFTDAVGNSSGAQVTYLYTDKTPPAVDTVTISAGYNNSGTHFYKAAPTPTALTLTDTALNETYQPASGVKGFVLTTSATAPANDTPAYDEWGYASAAACQLAFNTAWTGKTPNGWYRYTGSPADLTNAQLALAGILNDSSAQTVYLHVVDYAENVYSPATPVLTNAKLDKTSTTVDSCKLYGTNTTATTATIEPTFTSAATGHVAIMQFTEAAGESGLKTVTLSGDLDLTTMASTNPAVEYSTNGTSFSSIASSYSAGVITLTTAQTSGYLRIRNIAFTPGTSGSGTDGSRTLTVVAEDAVSNNSTGAAATKSDAITLDTVVPTATMWIKRSDGRGAQNGAGSSDTWTTSQLVTIHVRYTETGTGLSYLTFGGTGYSDLSTITSVKTSGGTDVNYSKNLNVLTLTDKPTGMNSEIVITGFTVAANIGSSNKLTVIPTDVAGGSGSAGDGYIQCDTTPPTITSPAISNVKTNNSKYYVGTAASVTPIVTATLSGQTHYLITNAVYADDSAGYAAVKAGTNDSTTALSQSITASTYFNASTTAQLRLYVTDDAGNLVGATLGSPTYLDSTGPTGTISIPAGTLDGDGYYYTNYYKNGSTCYGQTLPTVSPTGASDPDSGGIKYGTAANTAAATVTLSSGSNTVYAYDQLDNPGSSISVTGTADSSGPTATAAKFTATGIVSSGNTTVSISGTAGAVVESLSGLRTITISGGLFTASTELNGDTTGFTISTDHTVLLLTTPTQYTAASTISLSDISVTGSSDTTIHLTFKDALGNASADTSVAVDLPTATMTGSPVALNATFGAYTSGGTLTFTPSEASYWKITTDGLESSGSWSGSTVPASSTSQTLPSLSSKSVVYLHLKDANGNIWVSSAVSLGGTWTTDTTGPTPSTTLATNVSSKAILALSTNSYITNGSSLTFTMADDYCGSASYIVSTLDGTEIKTDSNRTAANSVNASGTATWETLAASGTAATGSVTVPFITILTTLAQTVYLHTKDELGNIRTSVVAYGSSGTSTQWTGDTTGPGLTYGSTTCNWLAGAAPIYYTNVGTVTFTVDADPAGIAGWTLSTSQTPGSYTTGSTAGSKTLNFPSPIVTTASLVYMCAKDALGNVSSAEIFSGRTWLVDSSGPDVTGMIASAAGFYFKASGSMAGTLYYKTNGSSTLTVITAPSDPSSVSSESTGVKGYGSSAVSAYSPSTATVPVGSTGDFFVSDNVGNATQVTVTHTQDITKPVFSASTDWSGTTAISGIATDTGGSGMKSITGITGSPATFADLASAGEYTIVAEDNVGNQNKAQIYATTAGVSLYLNLPSCWTAQNTPTDISGIVSVCSSWKLTGTDTKQGTGSVSNINNLNNGTYTLTLYPNSDYTGTPTIAVSFTTSSGSVSSIRVTGNPVIDDRLNGSLVSDVIKKKTLERTLLAHDTERSGLVSWSQPGLSAETAAIVQDTASKSSRSANATGYSDGSLMDSSFSTLSTRHSRALALARARFVASQNTDATEIGADKKSSPETANYVKQDDSGMMNGVRYDQEFVRLAQEAFAPLAERYLAAHGVSVDGVSRIQEGESAGGKDDSSQNGLPADRKIGMLMPEKDSWVFRRETES